MFQGGPEDWPCGEQTGPASHCRVPLDEGHQEPGVGFSTREPASTPQGHRGSDSHGTHALPPVYCGTRGMPWPLMPDSQIPHRIQGGVNEIENLAHGRGLRTGEMCSDPCPGRKSLTQPHRVPCRIPESRTQVSRQGRGQEWEWEWE